VILSQFDTFCEQLNQIDSADNLYWNYEIDLGADIDRETVIHFFKSDGRPSNKYISNKIIINKKVKYTQ